MEDSLKQLKSLGYKITQPRRAVLTVLCDLPMSAQDVHKLAQQHEYPADLVTIYRALELFTELGIVGKIQLGDSTARYEHISPETHHHHLICQDCKSVENVSFDEKKFVAEVGKKSQFKIKTHAVEFFGLCVNCQK